MKAHYIISSIIYVILVFTILFQAKYYNERVHSISQGSYYLGCINGMGEIYQTYTNNTTSVTETCISMAKSQDYDKIIRVIDTFSKGMVKK